MDQLRILIVDDEIGALDNLGDIFEARNFEVTKAADGKAAREAIQNQEFDVALLDIRLPDTRGTDLLREIRHASDTTRCIMVTASAEAEDAINALNDGASAYITKPIDVTSMLQKIEEVVAKYRKTVADRRRLRELDVVKSVGDVAMDLDMDRMLNNVLRAVTNGFSADAAAILLLEPERRTLRGAAQLGMSPTPVEDYRVPIGEGFAGRVAGYGRVLSVEDLYSANYIVPAYLSDSGLVSVIGAPVRGPMGVIGTLIIGWRSPRAFTMDDEHLIGVLAQRIGLATVNARLFALEDASRKRAEYLAMVSQELNSRIEDVRQVVERVTRLATERLGDGCAIFLKQPHSDVLIAVQSYHRVPEKQQTIETHLHDNPVRIGEGNVGCVAQTGQPIVTGPDAVDAYPERPYLAEVGIRAAMAIPLTAHGDVFGVMSVSITESDRRYSDDDRRLAQEFAERASVAIENAQLLREATEKRQELQALFEMTRIVTSSLEETEVLESLLKGTSELIDAPACCIATINPDRGTLQVNEETGISHEVAVEVVSACLRAWHRDIFEAGAPFSVPDLQDTRDPVVAACATRHSLRSMLSVPFEVEGRRAGFLVAFTHQVDGQMAQKLPLLSTLGGLSGVAITNARSFNREQKIAERLQQWILAPESNVDLGDFEVAMNYHAALNEASVGGDFFDIFTVGQDLVGIVIGDVSGKGLEAALHTQAVKHTLRAYALNASTYGAQSNTPHEVLSRTNDAVCFMLPTDIFITLFYAVLNVRDRTLRYANAGHDAPILCHSDGRIEMLESTGRAVGLQAGARYDEVILNLQGGDSMLLYTDGVTEARRNSEFLETEGVVRLLQKHAGRSAEDIVRGIYEDTLAYTGGRLHDDIALLALRAPMAT